MKLVLACKLYLFRVPLIKKKSIVSVMNKKINLFPFFYYFDLGNSNRQWINFNNPRSSEKGRGLLQM